jgi:hypothetical protein
MANTISNVFVQQFETNLRFLAQQSESKLRGTVMEKSVSAEKLNWERLGTIEAADKTTRLVDTPVQDTPWSRRVSIPTAFHVGDSTEQEDPTEMLIDPNSNLVRQLGMAMRRKVDDLIIAAATGNSLDGAGNAVTFPAGQKLGDGTGVIDFDTITAVQELFMTNDIDPSVPKVAVIGPTQVRKLMQLTQQTSSDYVAAQALQTLNSTGIVPNWMGFTWIVSNRLLAPSAGELSCLFYTRDAIGLQVNKDITARVAEDPSKSFAWRLYAHANMGATRVEDEQIVHLHIKDAMA